VFPPYLEVFPSYLEVKFLTIYLTTKF
jgi:hypothetical protein